jgi:hypothetical protein
MAGETTVTRLEVENGLRQHDLAIEAIKTFLEPDRPFALRPSLIQQLQSVAVQGIEAYPGQWRTGGVRIEKSRHSSGRASCGFPCPRDVRLRQ